MTTDGSILLRYMLMQKALLSSLNLKEVLDAAVVQVADLCGGAKVALLLSDNESLALKLMASCGYSEGSTEQLRVVPFAADSLLKQVVQKREAVKSADLKLVPDISASIMKREGSAGQIALPLIASNLLVGAIVIDIQNPQILMNSDFLKEVAEVISLVVANSILFGRSEYERQRLSTMYKTSCALSGSVLKVAEVLQIAADTALVIGNTTNCAILLYDPSRAAFSLGAFKGLEGNSMGEFDLNLENTPAGKCLASGTTEYLPDTGKFSQVLPRTAGGHAFGSVVALPMIHASQPLGVIMVLSVDSRAFHREQVELLETLSHQVSTALHTALTHESAASQSIQDAHTGLYNRWHFEECLAREIDRCQRHKRELALLLVDVDHLCQINQHLGQEKGDQAIKHVAAIIKATLRDIDIPCRFGGQEFAIILPETPHQNAAEVAERLRQQVRQKTASGIGMVTVSIGLSSLPLNAINPEGLLQAAEQALDIAKFEGRDRIKQAQAGLPASSEISWDELARQAKLAVTSERQFHMQGKISPQYADWMHASPAGLKKKGS